jgi:hypothetical protein
MGNNGVMEYWSSGGMCLLSGEKAVKEDNGITDQILK